MTHSNENLIGVVQVWAEAEVTRAEDNNTQEENR